MDFYYFCVFGCFAFALGACVASFLNVCIWRIPRGESVVRPPSHCPKCNAPIRWYQNIPIVSWCCLRGRCANCREPISVRYTVVEALGGVLFLLAYLQWAMPFFLHAGPVLGLVPSRGVWMVPACWAVIAWLIVLAFIDLEHSAFPSVLLYCGLGAGPVLSALVPGLQGETRWQAALAWSLAGAAAGFVSLALVRWLGGVYLRRVRKAGADAEAMGDGDPFFLGAVGAFFGPLAVLFTIIVSSFAGSLVGLVLIRLGRAKFGNGTQIPYGPYLAIGALAWMFWGVRIVDWYLSLGAGRLLER